MQVVSSEVVAAQGFFSSSYTEYIVDVQVSGLPARTIRKRYSTFEEFHQHILALHTADGTPLTTQERQALEASFPANQLFKNDPVVRQERVVGLQSYLEVALQLNRPVITDATMTFLDVDAIVEAPSLDPDPKLEPEPEPELQPADDAEFPTAAAAAISSPTSASGTPFGTPVGRDSLNSSGTLGSDGDDDPDDKDAQLFQDVRHVPCATLPISMNQKPV